MGDGESPGGAAAGRGRAKVRRPLFRRPVFLAAAGAAAGFAAAALLAFHRLPAGPLPSFREVRERHVGSESLLLDRRGEVLQEMRIDPKVRALDWAALRDVSPPLVAAVLRSEDRRFRGHRGVDWTAAASAAVHDAFGRGARGASTVTMQLVPFLDGTLSRGTSRRTAFRKLSQMRAALALEKTWSKDEILEAYLNLVSFRGELKGISAASWGLFGKDPGGLSQTESLLLAALLRSPNASEDGVVRRAARLAAAMGSPVSSGELSALAATRLNGPGGIRPRAALAPHAARLLLSKSGERVASTLSADVQRFASSALACQMAELAGRHAGDGAILAVSNRTGDILAYVGNAGDLSSARYVDGVRARRQAGSTLKPFLYGLAIERRVLTAASLLSDSPLDVQTAVGLYAPKNYDREYKGLVSVRTSLAGSLNVPAVRAGMLVGEDAFVGRLKDLGFSLEESGDYYGPSLALGAADVSLFELVNAYRTLANGGAWSPLRLLPGKGPGWKRAMSAEAAFIVSDILADREARSVTFGLENPLSTRFRAAVKTGTSKDMRDNWCVGYTRDYTVGVWIGNFSGEPMRDVSGVTGAAPLWLEVMKFLHRGRPGTPPRPPEGVVSQRVAFEDGVEPPRTEWFLKGTERGTVALAPRSPAARIAYPAGGEIIAIDPDIPPERQEVFFEADGDTEGLSWTLDGEPLAPAGAASWKPRGGNHTVRIVDARGATVDEVAFVVRGTYPR